MYEQDVKKRMENGKIVDEDMNELVASLIIVSDYLEEIIRGVDPDANLPVDENDTYSRTVRNWQLGETLK